MLFWSELISSIFFRVSDRGAIAGFEQVEYFGEVLFLFRPNNLFIGAA